jgi:hypothetical protein
MVWLGYDRDPGEPQGSGKLAAALSGARAKSLVDYPEEWDEDALVGAALEASLLVRDDHGRGIHVEGHDPPAPEPDGEPEDTAEESDADDGQGDSDDVDDDDTEGDSAESADASTEELAELQATLNRDLAILKGTFRELFGLGDQQIDMEDLPELAAEFREEMEQHGEFVADVQDQLDIVDDLDGDEMSGSKSAKLRRLRQRTVEKYEDDAGSIDYKEIVGMFDVSESYASKLLAEAADHRWFYTAKPGDRTLLRARGEEIPPGHVFRGNNGGE